MKKSKLYKSKSTIFNMFQKLRKVNSPFLAKYSSIEWMDGQFWVLMMCAKITNRSLWTTTLSDLLRNIVVLGTS